MIYDVRYVNARVSKLVQRCVVAQLHKQLNGCYMHLNVKLTLTAIQDWRAF